MTSRLLPPAEWPRLEGTILASVYPAMNPGSDRIIVVEDDEGTIIGCAALLLIWHLAGPWIAPASRQRVSVYRRLYRAAHALFRVLYIREIYVMAATPTASAQCQRLDAAIPLPCDHFVVRVG